MYKQSQVEGDERVLLNLVDSRLVEFDKDQVLRSLKMSLLCTLDNPELRPTTPQALAMLLGSEPIPDMDLQSLVQLEYPKSFHELEFGVATSEAWSDTEMALDEPPLLSDITSRH